MAEEKVCQGCKKSKPLNQYEVRRGIRKNFCIKCRPPKGRP